ncbi:hypothetical protein PR048_000423 [Dryococelus australis]|uniref:Uncharacterized protein n=1 Tax=Dryococelus australis TaxID=614101 RepID=A0ABQ9IEK1_9NEOP|nr:hypothetical protein PR048_000423 [Dryococelus australis]
MMMEDGNAHYCLIGDFSYLVLSQVPTHPDAISGSTVPRLWLSIRGAAATMPLPMRHACHREWPAPCTLVSELPPYPQYG